LFSPSPVADDAKGPQVAEVPALDLELVHLGPLKGVLGPDKGGGARIILPLKGDVCTPQKLGGGAADWTEDNSRDEAPRTTEVRSHCVVLPPLPPSLGANPHVQQALLPARRAFAEDLDRDPCVRPRVLDVARVNVDNVCPPKVWETGGGGSSCEGEAREAYCCF